MARRQLNIRIDEETHTRAKIIAVLKGITLNDYIEQAIQKKLEEDKATTNKFKKLQ
jgi:predicted HicB family RNase H-like nuclease